VGVAGLETRSSRAMNAAIAIARRVCQVYEQAMVEAEYSVKALIKLERRRT
jgi:hypothetical protein